MGRRTATVTIAAEGRDKGRTYRITEMPADAAERWAMRALLAFANAGARMPEGTLDSGMAGVAASLPGLMVQALKSLAGLRYEDVDVLLSEMMACVDFVPGANIPPQPLLPGDACQVEEVQTRLQLRYEVLQVHVGFSLADAFQKSTVPPGTSAA